MPYKFAIIFFQVLHVLFLNIKCNYSLTKNKIYNTVFVSNDQELAVNINMHHYDIIRVVRLCIHSFRDNDIYPSDYCFVLGCSLAHCMPL